MRSVEVTLEGSRIVRVSLETRTYPIAATLEHWRSGMRWWRGEVPRDYFLLETRGGRVFEVYAEVFS